MLTRRATLKAGSIGLGLGMAQLTALRSLANATASPKAKRVLFVFLTGGLSQHDSFDMKPDAPAEIRGEFRPIATRSPGLQICEHLPKLAKCADKFAILRGVSHTLAAHRLGSEYVNTGNRPLASLSFPGYGSVVAKETENENPVDLPPVVSVPNANNQSPGFLGIKYAPLNTGATPQPGRPFSVRGISLGNGLTVTDVAKRQSLLSDLDQTFKGYERQDQLLEGLDKFAEQAHAIISSRRSREAFDISKESPNFSKQFPEDAFGQSCLLATRLIESGVRFITLSLGGWDTHRDNFTSLKERRLPPLDGGLSSLLIGLEEKGLLDSTAIFVTGEFGRTPKINTRTEEGGRDHYPRCMFMLMAGGSVQGGQVVGESDDKATGPKNDAITPDDAAATFYRNIGVDFTKEYHSDTGRPITIVRNGQAVEQLFS